MDRIWILVLVKIMQKENSYSNFSDTVRAASDIVATISAYVPLKRRGHNYWGCCPFHNEKTPSFSVVPDEGFFYCFGCHKGGNVFKFLSLIEGIEYKDAIRLQAQRLNIPLPQKRALSAHEIEIEQKKDNLYRVLSLARNFFFNCLTKTNYGKNGLSYLQGRQIDKKIIEKFSLGFAPPLWDKLFTSFAKRGISPTLLSEAGLCLPSQKQKGYYDRFRNRVMIPIADEHGKVVGFGGRVISSDEQPKYLNSPETEIFNKRQLLFGLNTAKSAIRQADFAIIVEGYMDAIALASHGFENTVASLGTAFTVQQCTKLLRFTKNLYFCYDSDNAGQQATLRALSIAREQHASVRIIIVPDGKDPDEFIRKHDAGAFRQLVKGALSFLSFHLQYIKKTVDLSSLEGRVKAVSLILPILKSCESTIELNDSIAAAARSIGIDEIDLRNEFTRRQKKSDLPAAPDVVVTATQALGKASLKAARCIISCLWYDRSLAERIFAALDETDFISQPQKEIVNFLQNAGHEVQLSNEMAAQNLSEPAYTELLHCLAMRDIAETSFDSCLHSLQLRHLKRLYQLHSQKASELERKGDSAFLQELEKLQRIIKEMDELNDKHYHQ